MGVRPDLLFGGFYFDNHDGREGQEVNEDEGKETSLPEKAGRESVAEGKVV